ncbi:hypothetical protein SPBR_09017 [Sporothrix brasiliensis 5110]|uniref:Uncharacterized protein n=1 Tax=Sporothrix brasiliensis 5110 TaxID=1398154 RepID=A0A0C2ESB5_9PEZI|nr:uncharacterized protein SPBR_09017 [Sporothrix brasiliensis 5110]KIH89244.1 hypothetical protein SPBR_09017 [Sporothrix brasiliensis 5110]
MHLTPMGGGGQGVGIHCRACGLLSGLVAALGNVRRDAGPGLPTNFGDDSSVEWASINRASITGTNINLVTGDWRLTRQ